MPRFLSLLPLSRDISAAVEAAAEALRRVGMVEDRVSMPLRKVALESAGVLSREWLRPFRAALGGGQPIRFGEELIAHYCGKPRVSSECMMTLAMFSVFGPMLQVLGYGRLERIKKLRAVILQSMGPGSLILWPVFPTTPPKHGFAWKPGKSPSYTLIFNCLGFPALAMPVGFTSEGLPLSVQVIGQPNEDETVLAAAAALEKSFGGCTLAPISGLRL